MPTHQARRSCGTGRRTTRDQPPSRRQDDHRISPVPQPQPAWSRFRLDRPEIGSPGRGTIVQICTNHLAIRTVLTYGLKKHITLTIFGSNSREMVASRNTTRYTRALLASESHFLNKSPFQDPCGTGFRPVGIQGFRMSSKTVRRIHDSMPGIERPTKH